MPAHSRNRVDELANRLSREGKAAEVESELDKLDRADLNEAEIEAWYNIRGIAAFARGDRPLAMSRFLEAHAAFPQSARIAFSLGQEYEYIGDPASMFRCFDGALFPGGPARQALWQSRYAYLWGDIRRAAAYIQPVLEAYFSLGIADDTFLWMRGMPFFSETWGFMAAFAELTGDLEPIEDLTQRAASDLRDINVSSLAEFLACMRNKDFSQYEGSSDDGTGYERARAAVIQALRQTHYSEAEQILSSVKFSGKDFPWLQDILLLGTCEAAHRCEPSAEPELVQQFFNRQRFLFEPHHAVNFRLLAYQELLRPVYQTRRTSTLQ